MSIMGTSNVSIYGGFNSKGITEFSKVHSLNLCKLALIDSIEHDLFRKFCQA